MKLRPPALGLSSQPLYTANITPVQADAFRQARPQIVGADVPAPPFPIHLAGDVQQGFGRGGKVLGCPTANLPDESLVALSTSNVNETGVYYGFARITSFLGTNPISPEDGHVFPMIMLLGPSPFYKLKAEIHLMHEFRYDFYGHRIKALVLGRIRPELDYTSPDAVIADIILDKRVALNCLSRPAYAKYWNDPFFSV